MCTSDTEREAHSRLSRARGICHDAQRTVCSASLQSDLFPILVWTPQYKAEVLHHAAVSSIPTVMFVVASTSTIIHSVIVESICLTWKRLRECSRVSVSKISLHSELQEGQ